jgi:hypothetical protein
MKRIALMLAILGILSVAAGQAQAHEHHYAYGHHYGWYAPVVVRPQWVAPPRAIVTVPVARPVYPYGYGYYYPGPACGVYYQSRGLSIGVGF